jgi:hypothetical protein
VGHVHAEFAVPMAGGGGVCGGVPVLGTPSSWIQHSIISSSAEQQQQQQPPPLPPRDRVAYEDIPPGWRLIRLSGGSVRTTDSY